MEKRIFILLSLAAFAALTPGSAAAAPKADQEFVMEAAQGGHAEVKAGQLARSNATDAGVKQFGEMIIADHGRAGKELEDIARVSGLIFPPDTDAEHQQKLDALAAKKGRDFDQAYIAEMVAGHQKMAVLLESMAKEAKNVQVQDWAKRTLPAVQAHLKKAEEIKASLR